MDKVFRAEKFCAVCKGDCCKSYSGILFPLDFDKINEKAIISLLKTGNYSIDYLEASPPVYFIRPRHKNHDPENWIDPSWGGECVFLTSKGCSLRFHKRPYGCKVVEPNRSFHCKSHGGDKYSAAKAWKPYQKLFTKILEKSGDSL